MSKIIEFDSSIFEKFLDGVKTTTKIVGETLGPLGNNVVLYDGTYPKITKDGITVLRSVEFDDQISNAAADLIRNASDKTNREAGDGTTGTAILAGSIYENGLKIVSVGGNKIQIRNGIAKAAKRVVEFIEAHKKEISTKEEIRRVAKISSNHSDEIADILADVFDKIGENGTIKVESGNGMEIESKIVEGMSFQQGYVSPMFATNERMECDLDNPYIFIIGKKLSNISEILKPLQVISKTNRPIFIIADTIEGDAISTLVLNKLRGLQVCAVKSPSYGENKKRMLEDIAILTGGNVISEETGVTFESALPDSGVLGTAKRVIVTKDSTTIIGGNGDKESIKNRIEQIKALIYNSSDEFDLKKLRERLAKLDGGVGIISVGAKTEAELLEKKDLVDDAFCACKAAIKSGIVPGGGVTLLLAKQDLTKFIEDNTGLFYGDELVGAKILRDSLDAPIRKIISNAGESADIIVAKIVENSSEENNGYDVLNKKFGNMIELGIIDPAQVIISEVNNASSIAGLLLTSSAAIIKEKEKDPPKLEESPGMSMIPGMM